MSATRPWALRTRLAPEECVRRLKERTVSRWELFSSGLLMRGEEQRPVYGSVNERGFSLCMRIRYRNSFQTRAAGTFLAEPAGTRIDVRFGPATSLRMFWFVGVLAVLSFAAISAANVTSGRGFAPLVILLVPLGASVALIAARKYGRWIARNEETQLREFLARELEASAEPTVEPIQ